MREYYRYMTNSTINDLGGTDITGFQNEDGKISAGDSNAALLSFFARVNYDYDNKYLPVSYTHLDVYKRQATSHQTVCSSE